MHQKFVKRTLANLYLLVFGLLFFSSCNQYQAFKSVIKKQTPYEKYQQSLEHAAVSQTALAQDWLKAGRKALKDSVVVQMPFKERGYFPADKPAAVSYRLRGEAGQVFAIQLEVKSKEPLLVFMDLFSLENSGMPQQVAYADSNATLLNYEIETTGWYLLRLQPELLRSAQYTVTVSSRPVLAFPVMGKDSRHVASFWGAERDNGYRKHEGIDIFAGKGTPVLAAASGIITRVQETPIGGKVVWLTETGKGRSFYYAHLDKQLVRPGQQVQPGDTIGLVGNTGNAITTPPHLHFGIYSFGTGAVDPFPFVKSSTTKPAPITADLEKLGLSGRTKPKQTFIYSSPLKGNTTVATALPQTAVTILGGTADWFRVLLPDGVCGYVKAADVQDLHKPLRKSKLVTQTDLQESPETNAPAKELLPAGTLLEVLASAGEHYLVRLPQASVTGWVLKSAFKPI